MPPRWKDMPIYVVRALTWSALRSIKRSHGGIWTGSEACQIVRDLVPDHPFQVYNKTTEPEPAIDIWTKEQCWEFVLRGLLTGVVTDNQRVVA